MFWFVIAIFRPLIEMLFKVELINKNNIPNKGAAILCSNHIGMFDMVFISYRLRRKVRWMAKEELFRNPLFGSFITWLGAFPIKRGKGDVDSIKTSLKLLKEGHILGIFPEGTRTGGREDKKGKVNRGAAVIAMMANVPILPVAVDVEYKLFGKAKVVYGEPFMLDIEPDRKYLKSEMVDKTWDIMHKIYDLLEEK